MYPRGLLPTDLAGGQEKGETLGQVLVPLLTQPLADLAFDLVLVDHRPRVLGHVESSPILTKFSMGDLTLTFHNCTCNTNDIKHFT